MLKNGSAGFGLHALSKRLCLMAVATAVILVSVTSQAAASDWKILFDGTSLAGWQASRDNDQFELIDGVILASSTDQTRFLHTTKEYGDFELELEVKIHDVDVNSGVQIRTSLTRVNEKGDARFVVHGPQVDLGKSPGRSGYIYGQGNKGWITPQEDLKAHSLMVNGEWNKVRVLAVGPRIQTWINGEKISDLVNEDIYAKYPKGVIALQVHGVKKSPERVRHISFREIRIRELEE